MLTPSLRKSSISSEVIPRTLPRQPSSVFPIDSLRIFRRPSSPDRSCDTRLSAMRVAVGGIFHETNTFASGLTSLDDFRAYQFAEGAALLDYSNTRSELGGFIAGSEKRGGDILPALYAAAAPSATAPHPATPPLTSPPPPPL